jgi:hypothetical protein
VQLIRACEKHQILLVNLKMKDNMLLKNKLPYLSLLMLLVFFSCRKEQTILPDQKHIENGESRHSCGTDEYLEMEFNRDPGLKARMAAIEKIPTNKNLNRSLSATLTIPVVVHVVYNTPDQNLSDAQIQSQIDVLNEDYSRQNADAINTPAHFQTLAANTNIQFVLAKQDPNGNATTGITRTSTTTTSFTTNGYVKYDSYGGKNAWNTTQYLNIWVCNLASYAGYSTVPGSAVATDGVVIDYLSFGRIGTLMSTTKKGRTAVHEIGHWLGLAHLWGPSGTCGDDGVADTPTQEKSNSGFPVFPHLSACSPDSYGDMFMSYMDYTDDGAMNMFSVGQSERMNSFLNGYRSSLLSSPGLTAPGSSITTCNVPSGAAANSVTTSGAIVSWTSTGALSYSIRYKAISSSTWMTVNSTSASLSLTGLLPSTPYEFQVSSVCDPATSSAFSSSVSFTTSVACATPTGLFVSALSNNGATLNWASTGASAYTIRYKQLTSGTWITITSSTATVSIAGLSAYKKYEFQVAGNCTGATSSFSASKVFTTLKNGRSA